jgi:hypothetical protein
MEQYSHKIMTFTREQIQNAYKKLPPEVQSFIMDTDTTELIEKYLKEVGLSEEQSNMADSEILYAMFGLQTLSVAIENIAKLSNKSIDSLSGLKAKLSNSVFNHIPQRTEVNPRETPQSNIGISFEKIILNQAKAMQPARPADEAGRVTSYGVRDTKTEDRDKRYEIRDTRGNIPGNLPVEKEVTPISKPQISVPNYSGNDPYREPTN